MNSPPTGVALAGGRDWARADGVTLNDPMLNRRFLTFKV